MLQDSHAFSGFSVNDPTEARKFYGEILGLDIQETPMGLTLKLAGGNEVFIYAKPDHQPATFTILNFPVKSIDKAVDELSAMGVEFQRYDSGVMQQDEKGIARGRAAKMGPDIAWFKDPAGNILSILQN